MRDRRRLAPEIIQGRAEDIEWMLDTGEITDRIITRAGFPSYDALMRWLSRYHLSALQQRVAALRNHEIGRDYEAPYEEGWKERNRLRRRINLTTRKAEAA